MEVIKQEIKMEHPALSEGSEWNPFDELWGYFDTAQAPTFL